MDAVANRKPDGADGGTRGRVGDENAAVGLAHDQLFLFKDFVSPRCGRLAGTVLGFELDQRGQAVTGTETFCCGFRGAEARPSGRIWGRNRPV